jgi:hypothetical protein
MPRRNHGPKVAATLSLLELRFQVLLLCSCLHFTRKRYSTGNAGVVVGIKQ